MAYGKTTVGLLAAFGIGFVMGGQSGKDGLDEIGDAAKEVVGSEEFAALIITLRTHIGRTLQEFGGRLGGDDSAPLTVESLLERARGRFAEDPTDS
jgi:hypothetical protein